MVLSKWGGGGQKDPIIMKKWVNWIENQGENIFKMLQNFVKWKVIPTLDPTIPGTNCFFSAYM